MSVRQITAKCCSMLHHIDVCRSIDIHGTGRGGRILCNFFRASPIFPTWLGSCDPAIRFARTIFFDDYLVTWRR